MLLDSRAIEDRYRDFDVRYFGGQLQTGTVIELLAPMRGNHLAQPEDGACKHDGSVIYLSPREDYDWQSTLLHEMVHAFEARFPDQIQVTEEAVAVERCYPPHRFYGGHSARFFAKLFEVMRARGHDPQRDLRRYFD